MKLLQSTSFILISFLLVGCMGKSIRSDNFRNQINVFGIELLSSVDHRELKGVSATEEPCLKGYERSFDALDIIIGYGFNHKIRRITTRNPRTCMFGISPGLPFREGRGKILQAGFVDSVPPYQFKADGCSFTFLVDGNGIIFGLTIELID